MKQSTSQYASYTKLLLFSLIIITTITTLSSCTKKNIIDYNEICSEGYIWDEDITACTKEGSLNAEEREAAKIVIMPMSYRPITIVEVRKDECETCFIVNIKSGENKAQEIKVRQGKLYFEETDLQDFAKGKILTFEDAIEIAEFSNCTKEGKIIYEGFYNEGSGTWWISLDAKKEGCNPACVVYESTLSAEINWRCTGLVEQ